MSNNFSKMLIVILVMKKMCKTKLQDAILFFIKKKKKDVKNREKDLKRVLSLKLVV